MTNIQLALSALKPGELLKIEPQGTSMCPTFYGGRDYVYIEPARFPLKRGDIAVYQRTDGTYIIHRVYKIKTEKSQRIYSFVGDNQIEIEYPIYENQIHGVVRIIVKKGKTINCKKNPFYRLYASVWLIARPFRHKIMGLWIKFFKKQ